MKIVITKNSWTHMGAEIIETTVPRDFVCACVGLFVCRL